MDMNMDKQDVLVHVYAACHVFAACCVRAACQCLCWMDIDMQHGHGHAAWTWACSMDMDMQHEHTKKCTLSHHNSVKYLLKEKLILPKYSSTSS
jgi:hypothetical protein